MYAREIDHRLLNGDESAYENVCERTFSFNISITCPLIEMLEFTRINIYVGLYGI